MIGYMHYNRFGITGFTDSGRGRSTPGGQTCPVCPVSYTHLTLPTICSV